MNLNLSPQMQKTVIAGVLFAAWSVLVYKKLVPAGDYVENIKTGLGALGLYHMFTRDTSSPASTPPAAPPKDAP